MMKTSRILAVMVSVFMVFTMTPAIAFADTAETWTGGHIQHDEYCGYAEAKPCAHEQGIHINCDYDTSGECSHIRSIQDGTGAHDASCGYTAEISCIYDPANHPYHSTALAATCVSPAKCACGAVSDNGTDPANHTGGTELRDSKEATPKEDGYTGDTYCLGCGELIASGEIIPATGINTQPDNDPEAVDKSDSSEQNQNAKPVQTGKTNKSSVSSKVSDKEFPEDEKQATLELYEALGISYEDLEAAMPAGANDADLPVDEQSHIMDDFVEQKIYDLMISEGNRNGSDEFAKNGRSSIHVHGAVETATKGNLKKMLHGDGFRYPMGEYSTSGIQARNVCAINLDKDRTDEAAIYELKKNSICILFIENMEEDIFSVLGRIEIPVENLDGESVEAMATKGLMSMAAGDYDRDGMEELAFYVPGVSIKFAEAVNGKVVELTDWEIPLSEIRTSEIYFEKWRRPIVGLDTTSISGEDDLVVNISMPLKDGGVYKDNDHLSTMAILSTGHTDQTGGSMEIVYSDQKLGFTPSEETSNNKRHSIRFASAEDADVNGDGKQELLVAGFRTQGFNNSKHEAGGLDDNVNLIQGFKWDEEKGNYQQIWDYPQEVNSLTGQGLNYDYDMQEPAAFAAGRFVSTQGPDQLFLEGVILQWAASGGEMALETGEFYKVLTVTLAGRHNAFISTAYAETFAKDSIGQEQVVFMSGHEKTTDEDLVYYDLGCVYTNENGAPESNILHDNYVDNRNEDDSGTYLSICPIDNDPTDSVYYEYQGKEVAWTNPQLLAVIQPTPYWNESDSEGSVWWTFSETEGSGKGKSGQLGISPYLNIETSAGAGLLDNKATVGKSFSLEATISYLNEKTSENSVTKAVTLIFDQGRDHGDYYTAVMGIPIVRYKYKMWTPAFTVTKEYIENYNELAKQQCEEGEEFEPCPYEVGQVVEAQFTECSVDEYGQSTYVAMPVDKYNEVARNYSDKLVEVTDEMYVPVTPGDPSTYPTSETAIKSKLGAKNINLGMSELIEVDNDSSTESRLEYVVSHSESTSDGFNITASVSGGVKTHVSVDLIVAFEGDLGAGITVSGGGGQRWYDMGSESTSFSGTFCEFNGFPDSYNYSTKLAVYKTKVKGDGDKEFSGPYVMSYIVKQTNGAPPKLAENFLAQNVTADSITLTWENPDYRTPKSYRIFIRDKAYGKNAEAQELAVIKAGEPLTYTATGLDPDTVYEFAITSYGDSEGDANPSCMSPWLSQRTKSDSERYPVITQQPENLVVTNPEDETQRVLTVAAREGADGSGAEMRYQWQKFDAVQFAWTDVAKANESTFTVPKADLNKYGSVFYRVVVTQMRGSVPYSIFSDAVSVTLNPDNANAENRLIASEMTVTAEDAETLLIRIAGGKEIPDGSVTVVAGKNKKTQDLNKTGSAKVSVEASGNDGYIIYYSGGKSAAGEVYLPALKEGFTFD